MKYKYWDIKNKKESRDIFWTKTPDCFARILAAHFSLNVDYRSTLCTVKISFSTHVTHYDYTDFYDGKCMSIEIYLFVYSNF